MANVREPAVAGYFYPSAPDALDRAVTSLLAAVEPIPGPVPKALIVPHAGYVYSGSTAAQGYALLHPAADQITRVLLLGPCHQVAIRGLATSGANRWRTPLGEVGVDTPAVLADLPQVVESRQAHAVEHSLEVQVPFLQKVLGEFTLIPLAVGAASGAEVAEVIDALWGGPETLVVISSDLSHYRSYQQANLMDRATIGRIEKGQEPIDHERACGATPINGLLVSANRRGLNAELVAYRNSGDTAGDKSRVVGYGCLRLGDLR